MTVTRHVLVYTYMCMHTNFHQIWVYMYYVCTHLPQIYAHINTFRFSVWIYCIVGNFCGTKFFADGSKNEDLQMKFLQMLAYRAK